MAVWFAYRRPEKVMHVTCADQFELTRAAYHLGNRHVPVQIGDATCASRRHVLCDMLLGLGGESRGVGSAVRTRIRRLRRRPAS